jgi:hypothetical protein
MVGFSILWPAAATGIVPALVALAHRIRGL